MVDTASQRHAEALGSIRKDYEDRITVVRGEIQTQQMALQASQAELASLEEGLRLLSRLLDLPSGGITRPEDTDAGDSNGERGVTRRPDRAGEGNEQQLETAVQDILRNSGAPLHISQIREALGERGIPIPGRGDDANIIVRLARLKDVFVRTARGTYALAEWGLPSISARKVRRRAGRR